MLIKILFSLFVVFMSVVTHAGAVTCSDGYYLSGGECKKFEPEFVITTTSDTKVFTFQVSAAGNYIIDWGDGKIEPKTKNDLAITSYSHTYTDAGKYTIGISGQATAYATDAIDVNRPAISFSQNKNIAGISGSLGAIFGTLANGDNPRFKETFYACSNISSSIPANLFQGISGKPTKRMFMGLFSDCTALSGGLSAGLFAGLTGAVTERMFQNAFYNCKKLTGGIPSGLFRVTGAPQAYMFYQTFRGCIGLTGTIGDGLFASIKGAPAESMFQDTFSQILPSSGGVYMKLTGSIPANLFAGISGAPAYRMFYNTFYGCNSLSGQIPGELFKGIKGPINGTQAFRYTFEECAGLTGYVPPELFMGVTYNGTYPNDGYGDMSDIFYNAHRLASSCTSYGLREYRPVFQSDWDGRVSCLNPEFSIQTTNMPANTSFKFTISAAGKYLIDWGDGSAIQVIDKSDTSVALISHTYTSAGVRTIGIVGQATGYYTAEDGRRAAVGFSWGDNVNATANHYTAKISGSLGAIFGTLPDGTQPRFNYTFYDSPNLKGAIPADLFAGIKGQPISYMFDGTFFKTGLTDQIPAGLFKDIIGKPVTFLFTNTFSDCYYLDSTIPETLFSGISGAPAPYMFYQTFYNDYKIKGSIPAGLFAKIDGAPAEKMFRQTFTGCSGITGSIPADLFKLIQGEPAPQMFYQTFRGCSGLTGQIPPKLFFGITGMPATDMYNGTFQNCSGLTGNVPVELFGRINNTNYKAGPLSNVLNGSGVKTTCPEGMIQYHTGFEADLSGCKACWVPKFIMKIDVPANTNFEFSLSAAGDYTIDWGDGTRVEAVSKKTTVYENVTHKYVNAGVYTIGFSGNATDYSQPAIGEQYSAISFSPAAVVSNNACNYITGISGSLGKIFPTISDDEQPSFRSVFDGCSKMSGNIPAKLFDGISGDPIAYMFEHTFKNCSSLTGNIPNGLFGKLSGSLKRFMFYGTFWNCTGLTGQIPSDLFSGIKSVSDDAEGAYSNTFNGCSGLNGNIPGDLFKMDTRSKIANRMFADTFKDCTGLTGSIPAELFDSLYFVGEIDGTLSTATERDPGAYAFYRTFGGCSKLDARIPADLFGNISGYIPYAMFVDMFNGAFSESETKDATVPLELFANITYSTNYPGVSGRGPMSDIFENSGVMVGCPEGMEPFYTGYEIDWSGRAVCVDASMLRTLHIGDETMRLSTIKPKTSRVMVFDVLGELYYGGLSNTPKPINNGTEKQFRILDGDTSYWMHDYTVK